MKFFRKKSATAKKMNQNPERRNSARISHISPVQVKNLNSGKICKARMFNYSKNGIYFESDRVLTTGEQIYIGIQDSPYASLSGVMEYYRGKVMWRKKLSDAAFRYGYGVQFVSAPNGQNRDPIGSTNQKDLRKHPRKSYVKSILFAARNGVFEGSTKNISPSGVFVAAKETFEVGHVITVSLPLKEGKEARIKGEIVWTNNEGFGLRFLGKINE